MSLTEVMEKKTVVMGRELPTVALVGGALALIAVGAVIMVKNRKKVD